MLPRTADIVIIGAGVIGASIAYHLSRENIRAVVLEKKEIASGSSGACEGLLLMQSKKPGLHSELAQQSLQRFPSLVRALDHPIEFENKGGVVVIESRIAAAGDVGFAVEQAQSGNILIGSTREFVGYDKDTTFEGILTLARNIVRVIPGLRNLQVIRSFAGLRPYTPDGLPILGRVDAIDGFIIAAGHEGDGITLAPITGEMIAELVSTGSAPDPLSDLSLDRFSSRT